MLPAFFVPENGGGDQGRGTFRSMVPSERIARTFSCFLTEETVENGESYYFVRAS